MSLASPARRRRWRSPTFRFQCHFVRAYASGAIEGRLVVNPTARRRSKRATWTSSVAGTDDNLVMVEGGCDEVSEDDMVAALDFAHAEIRRSTACSGAWWKRLRCARRSGRWCRTARFDRSRRRVAQDWRRTKSRDISRCASSWNATRAHGPAHRRSRRAKLAAEFPETTKHIRSAVARPRERRHAQDDPRRRCARRRSPAGRDPADHHRSRRCCRAPTARRCSRAARPRRLAVTTLGTSKDEQRHRFAGGGVEQALHAALQLPARSASTK